MGGNFTTLTTCNLDTKLEGVQLIYDHCTDPVLLATAKRVLDSAADLERDIKNLKDYVMKSEVE